MGDAGNSSENNVVREKDSFQVELRIRGESPDTIYEDEERTLEKRQDGYRTNSISTIF